MWTPNNSGVFLKREDTQESKKIIIKILRVAAGDYSGAHQSTALTLHIKKEDGSREVEDCETPELDYDPWSDINVVPDGSIDEKDINALTQLALAFYHQKELEPEAGVFIALIPVDAPRRLVRIEILDLEDNEQPEFDYLLNATSF